jgi:hypothetical protein
MGCSPGLAAVAQLGDLDVTVEHDKQFAPGRAFLENDLADTKLVDAFFDGHGSPPSTLFE